MEGANVWRTVWLAVACGCRVGFDPVPVGSSSCEGAPFALPGTSSFADDFSTGAFTDKWDPISGCVDQIGGELVAAPPAAALQYCHAWTRAHGHLACDSVTVRVPEVTSMDDGAQTLIYVLAEGHPYMTLLLELGKFHLRTDTTPDVQLGTYDPARDVWWQLRENAGTVFFDTSPDGVGWTNHGSAADPIPLDDVTVAIGAGTWRDVAAPGRARFHCYNIPPPCQ